MIPTWHVTRNDMLIMDFGTQISRSTLFVLSIAFVGIAGFLPAHAVLLPENARCVQDPKDPYDPGQMFTYGKYKGQCVDSSQKRPIQILSENDQEIVFTNFRHMGKFWIAHFPKNSIDSVSFRIDPFGSGIPFVSAAHTLIRFDMKPGKSLLLQPQYEGEEKLVDPKDLTDVNSLFFSVNYMAPKNVEYNLFPGMASVYLEAFNFLSAHDRGNAKDTGKNAEQNFVLNLAPGAGDAYLVNALHASNEKQLNVAYNTYSENCTTALFDLMDETFQYDHPVKKFKVSHIKIFDELIGPSIHALKERGLIAEDAGKKNSESDQNTSKEELGKPVEVKALAPVAAPAEEPTPAPSDAPAQDAAAAPAAPSQITN